jgi:hypothetical protein
MHACMTTLAAFYNTKEGNLYVTKNVVFKAIFFGPAVLCGTDFSVNSCLMFDNKILKKYFCLYFYASCCKLVLKDIYVEIDLLRWCNIYITVIPLFFFILKMVMLLK